MYIIELNITSHHILTFVDQNILGGETETKLGVQTGQREPNGKETLREVLEKSLGSPIISSRILQKLEEFIKPYYYKIRKIFI